MRDGSLPLCGDMGLDRRAVLLAVAAGGSLLAAAPWSAWAQDRYPNRPVNVVIAYPPGGPVDSAARRLVEALQRQFGQPFVVSYKSGAAGAIAHAANAVAIPDGYTLLCAASPPQTMLPHSQKLQFDPLRDYTPIGSFAESQFGLVASGSYPPNSIAELIADAKARPGKVNFASSGVGSITQMASEVFRRKTNIDVFHIPYKGGGEAMADLISGTVQFMIVPITGLHRAHAKDGKLKILGVAAEARSRTLPNVPTFIEAGVPDYTISTWYALEGPPNLPAPVVEALSAALRKLPDDAEFVKSMNDMDIEVKVSTPQALHQRIQKEYVLWGNALKAR